MQDVQPKTSPLVAHIDPALKRQIKACAAERGQSMLDFVKDALREWVRTGKPRVRLYHTPHDLMDK
jgi:hypothetical protein